MSSSGPNRSFVLAIAAVVLAGVTLLAAPMSSIQAIQVVPLAREGRVMVSFQLSEGFPDDVKAAIKSGLMTTFAYDVEIKRSAAFWLDRTVASASVSASVKYDTLTRTFSVTRALDGRMATAENTENEATVRDMLTKFERLPLFSSSGLEPNAEYYLRVRAHTTPRTSWALWPLWGREVAGIAKFTFIP
jgi:Domain of unknown function (DUF4390)